MLNELLALLRAGGTQRVSDLARELDTTPVLVEAMLEDLARMGYLKRVNAQCCDGCASCPLSNSCAAGSASCETEDGQVWTLVDRPGQG